MVSLTRANRLFDKLGLEAIIRRAGPREQSMNEYGEKYVWALDNGPRQSYATYRTLNDAIADVLESRWNEVDLSRLTAIERRELRAIPSNVARLI